jgi:serine protease Do
MKLSNWGALAGAVVLAATTAPVALVHAQSRDTLVRAFEIGRGSRIGASVADQDSEHKAAGVLIEIVDPAGPADKAGMKAGDAVTEFDGERVRSVRQFLRLVQETAPGRSTPVVLSRAGQRITVNVTPERASVGDDFGMRFLEAPVVRPAFPPEPPPPPSTPRAPRPPALPSPAMPFDFGGRLFGGGRLGITIEDLDAQLAEYFGVKDGVLVKSVKEDSAAGKAGLKAGDVITALNGRRIYDTSDVTRALDRIESSGEVTLEVTRDRKTQTLKGKVEAPETRTRIRARTIG